MQAQTKSSSLEDQLKKIYQDSINDVLNHPLNSLLYFNEENLSLTQFIMSEIESGVVREPSDFESQLNGLFYNLLTTY